jgi:V8-like Glu-specific endopeptidase
MLAVVAVTAAAPGTIAAPATAKGSVGRTISARDQQRALDYWTPRRMRAARPYPQPSAAGRPRLTADEGTDGRAGAIAGSGSRNVDGGFVQSAPLPAAYTYPFPFTRYSLETALYSIYPYLTIGKLYFNQGGKSYVCSAASVVGNPRQIVFTAGHCMHDGKGLNPNDGWSSSVVFRPVYRNGIIPQGSFAADGLWARTAWAANGYFTEDLGAFSVGSPAVPGLGDGIGSLGGASLRGRVGTLGFAFNQGRNQHWDAFGYPAESPFTGGVIVKCESNAAGSDGNPAVGPGTDPTAIGCDMTGGSSGGPWIMRLNTGNYINGVNSYKYKIPPSTVNRPLAMFSPYFGSNANNVRCAAATGSGGATTC